MKAAVLEGFGQIPRYADFPGPIAEAGETLIRVEACVLEHFDKGAAAGTHYSSRKLFPAFPAVPGTDGVGRTPEGHRVCFGGVRPPYGAYAEQAAAGYTVPVPEGISAERAAAIPPSALTSLLPLKFSAALVPGETVLINGATGVSGRIAVQVARLLGAEKIVATGRNQRSLTLLKTLGADTVIDLTRSDEELSNDFRIAAGEKGFDVVVDFLWGRPAELLINTLIPREAGFPAHRTRYIQIGEKAGAGIGLPGSALRTSGLMLMGAPVITHETVFREMEQIWKWIGQNQLYMDIESVPLSRVSEAWQREDWAGRRLVLVP